MRWWTVVFLTTAVSAAGEEKPLPVKRSGSLNDSDTVYYVEGRKVIPRGVSLTIARGVKIVSRGRDHAVLVVEGSLRVQGTRNQRVDFHRVTIEPARRFQEIRLLGASFRQAGVRNDTDAPAEGGIVVEDTRFHGRGFLEVALCAGEVRIVESTFDCPVHIQGVTLEPKGRNLLEVDVVGCSRSRRNRYQPGARGGGRSSRSFGFRKGLSVTGARKVVVRNSCLGGKTSEFRNCATLTIDGSKILSTKLVLDQKSFAKTKLQKCDLYCAELVLKAAPRQRKQCVLIDKCYFRDLVRKKDIEDRVIKDGNDDKKCGAVAMLKQIKKQPLKIAE